MTQALLDLAGDRVLLVAEISANHGGSLERALETVQAAARAGADAVKIQTYTPDTMTLDCDRPEFRIESGLWAGRTLHDLYREAHTPWEWHEPLAAAAREAGVPLFSTPFDRSAVEFLEKQGVPAYKIASFELTDLELLRDVAATGRPVIVSTGMGTLAEIDRAVATLRETWSGREPGLALLHCVSAYPASPAQMNLRTIPHLAEAFRVVPGLSDHTLADAVPVAAVALGARVIEKHFILDRRQGGPDAAFSIEPAELEALASAVRTVEKALGVVRTSPTESELENRRFRRSIFVSAPVRAGERLGRENLRVIRPGHGLDPGFLPLVLGRRAARDLERGEPLRLELLD